MKIDAEKLVNILRALPKDGQMQRVCIPEYPKPAAVISRSALPDMRTRFTEEMYDLYMMNVRFDNENETWTVDLADRELYEHVQAITDNLQKAESIVSEVQESERYAQLKYRELSSKWYVRFFKAIGLG